MKLVLLFPGIKYTNDMPLLYYPGMLAQEMGYEVMGMDYGPSFAEVEFHNQDITNEIQKAQVYCLSQCEAIDYTKYDEIVFISKSLGTAVAGWIEKALHLQVKQIYLTPIAATLPYMAHACICIAGSQDEVFDSKRLQEKCAEKKIDCLIYPNCTHRIETGDTLQNVQIIYDILKHIKKYL